MTGGPEAIWLSGRILFKMVGGIPKIKKFRKQMLPEWGSLTAQPIMKGLSSSNKSSQ